jgi:hypothetical protein
MTIQGRQKDGSDRKKEKRMRKFLFFSIFVENSFELKKRRRKNIRFRREIRQKKKKEDSTVFVEQL